MGDPFDWDSIKEKDGWKVGDSVQVARCKHTGTIRNLIEASEGRFRALVYWPTIPFEIEGCLVSSGSVNFIDLPDLIKVQPGAIEQLELI